MELMPREPDGREQENTTPQRPGAPARSAVRPDAGEPRAIQGAGARRGARAASEQRTY